MANDLTTESTVYVTYIAAKADKVWEALTASAFTSKYFFGRSVESDWKVGSPWILRMPDGRVDVKGVVREHDFTKRLKLTWNVDWLPDPKPPECFVTYDVEQIGDNLVRLTMTEEHPAPVPKAWLEGGRHGWPMILSGLKTLVETGKPLNIPAPQPPKG